jgi:ribosomal protein L35
MKTNKTLAKRLKVTKNGKILARKSGQNHFNAKEGRQDQLANKRLRQLSFTNKFRSRYLANQ